MTIPQPYSYPCLTWHRRRPRVDMGIFDTITKSIFGKPDPNDWQPLSLSTLFSEGWNEAWVPSPNGSGGAPRQGWINAADGNLYRLWFFTFSQAFNQGPMSNAYLGAYTLYDAVEPSPEADHEHPLRDPQQRCQRIAHHLAVRGGDDDDEEPHDIRRYLVHSPRLAPRDARFSLTAEMAVVIPTGNQPLAGKTSLIPAFAFWNNLAGRWVIRGGIGDYIPRGRWE